MCYLWLYKGIGGGLGTGLGTGGGGVPLGGGYYSAAAKAAKYGKCLMPKSKC